MGLLFCDCINWKTARKNVNRDRQRLSRSQRMQIKAFICALGILLLAILLLGRFIFFLIHRDGEEQEHIPVVEILNNAWIMEADGEGLLVFHEGKEQRLLYGTKKGDAAPEQVRFAPPENAREQVADIELTDGMVTAMTLKTEKINGKILSADAESIEVEGYGRIPLAEDYKGYRIYGELASCRVSDLCFGYDFTDLVLENGKVCGLLMVKEEAMESIRALIKTSDFAGTLHESIVLTADTDFTIQYGSREELQQENCVAGQEIVIDRDSPYFAEDRIYVTPDVLTGKVILKNVSRSQGEPGYRGHMEFLKTEEGIAVINEVLLEEYLYSVVPSEMPSSYPDEALQAQAVCARTYAYGAMKKAGYPQYGAHVDDSTSYQVYNNILEQESTTTAVKETYGQLLFTEEGNPAETFYYSTSCGVGSDADVWKTKEAETLTYLRAKALNRDVMEAERKGEAPEESLHTLGETLRDEEAFASFIKSKNASDFEVTQGWYRWNYQVKKLNESRMLEVLQKRYAANEGLVLTLEDGTYISRSPEELEEVTGLSIITRGSGGVADELLIETNKHTYKVIGEYNIRAVLNDGESKILRQDGSEVASPSLLPSAFFILSPIYEKERVTGYVLTGGGFGHGVGMSQNGAKAMAENGYTSEEILGFFYEKCSIRNIYGDGKEQQEL